MSSSYNYEKALSLEWNGQLYVLTVRNETPLGAINYLYSYDGQSWYSSSDLSNSQLLTQANPYNVKWMGTNFAMVGNIANTAGNTILRSTTGTKFSALSTTGQGTNAPLYDLEANLEYPHTITFPRNMTLALGGAAGDTTKIAYSLDAGITWTPSINSSAVFSTTANNAVWNGKLWVAVGQGGNTIATSTDGNTWIGRGSYIFTVAGQGIAWSPEQALWVAAGQGTNSLAYSADGVYWTGVGTAMLGSGSDVQWNGTIWSAVGGPSAANKSIAYSYDGKTWSNPIQTNLFDISGNKTAWNGYFWTAIGSSTFSNSLYNMGTSVDGIYWYMQRNTNISTNITNIFTNPSITNEILFTTYGIPPDAATGLTATSSTASTITFLFTLPASVTMPVNSMLTNCLFWFDAANANSYTLGTGTTVASLVDSTGFGLVNTSMKQFRNSTGTPAISLTSNYINSLSAININNSGFIGTLTTAYTGIRMSFYYVVNVVTSNNSAYGRMLSMGQGGITGISGTNDASVITTFCLPLNNNTAPPGFTNIRNGLPNTYYSFVANTANILSGHFDGANLYTFLNGTAVGATTASVGAFNVNNFGIGLDTYSNSQFVDNIYLAEALVYQSSPGTYQRQIMEGYLASKWGITSSLPAGHPYKSVAPVPSVSMTLLQNCVLWLDAADATTYTTSGSNVTQWNDKSGAGNNMVQASATYQPLTGTTLNGLNIMNFSVSKIMQNTTMIFPNAPYTIFVVGYSSATGFGRLLSGSADTSLFFGTGNAVTQFATFVGNGSTWTDTNTNTPVTSVTSPCIMGMTNNGTTTGLIPYFNGVTMTAKSGICNVFTGLSVGSQSLGTQPWSGYIAEIMVYNYVLSTQQRQYVEGYLAGKWGIQSSLATLHPYKSIAPDTAMINNVNPTILANCIMWLDAADTSTLLLNGTNVLQWNDKSGSNNNASQTNATYQFTRDAAAQNGKGIIYTGTTLGYMTVPNIVVPVTNTVFIVAYTTVAPGTTACAISSTSDLQMRLNGTTGGVWINLGNSSAWNTANSTYGAGSINIISWTENATSVVIYGNGNKGGSNNGANVGYTGIVLGSNNFVTQVASNSQPWLGYIAEVLVYNRVIPTAQRQYIEGYLANKWGFKSGLPTNHPYYTATPPTNGIKLNNINSNILQTCLLWLDAADSDTLILSGANLMQWNDKSGNNNNATKFDTGTQPTYGATNFNSLPGIQMSTNQGFYAPMTSGITTNGISVFVVFQKNGANNTSETIFSRTSSNIAAPLDLYQSSRLYGTAASTNSSFTANFNIQNATTATLFNIVVSNTNWSEWVNGTLSTSNTITALFDNSSFFYIGTRADHLTYFTGVIAELMVYNSALPVAQRQYIEGYLAWKWNLKANLPVSHPYYSSGPTISTINPVIAPSSNLPSSYSILAAPSTGSSVTQTINYGATGGTATGLTPSTSYNLTLASVNSLGSSTSNTVTYQTILSPPTNLTFVTYSVSSINISFTPPVMSQGVTITSYTATAVPASGTTVTVSGISGAATSVNITGLEASTQYSITMVAINSYGTSASSSPLVYQTVLRPPYSIFAYMVDATSMSVSYVAPALGTNVSVTSYTASIVPTTGSTIVISNITSSPFTVTGLTYQMNYNISMISINSYSTSTSSAITNYSLSVLLTINGIVSGSTGTGLIAGNVANDVKSGASTSNSVIYNVYSFQPGTGILPPVATSSQTTYTINYSNGIATTIYVLAVGGGGGAGTYCGGGGGAGGVVMNSVILPAGTGTINVNVGAGGLGQGTSGANYATPVPVNGSNSTVTFSANTNANIVAYGGGFGQGSGNTTGAGNGGSGGGAGNNGGLLFGKAINQNNNYGNPGSLIGGANSQGCGGGGAGNVGTQNISTVNASNGGAGIQCFLPGISNFAPSGKPYGTYYWGGGGGGGGNGQQAGNGGIGGGGGGTSSGATTTFGGTGGGLALNAGGNGTYSNLAIPGAGGTNTGGGGGASVHNIAAAGGSGIVIIAFPSNVSIINNQSAVLPPAINSSGLYKAVLNDASFSAAAYSSIKGAYACRLLNYNYFGPVVTLRYNTDTTGSFTQNFYSDICGNMGTSYLGTGQSVSSWLSSNSAVTTYAFVTKWYSQGMDISFNSATQYNILYQPIYDVSYGVVNFGYWGAGSGGTSASATAGGVGALNAGYLNLPVSAFPFGNNDPSFTYITRFWNYGTNNANTQQELLSFGPTYGSINLNNNGSPSIKVESAYNPTSAALSASSGNSVISYKYTSYTSVGNNNNYVVYLNNVPGTIVGATAANNYTQNGIASIGNTNDIANGAIYRIITGTTSATSGSYFLQAQLYNLFAFKSALSDADRLLVEATPYQYSPLAQITLTLTDINATTFVTTWPKVTNVDSYIMYINGSTYGPVTSGQTITPGYNGPWITNLYAYDASYRLLATGYISASAIIVSPSITNWKVNDVNGTAITNGITYNVYAFKTTGVTYTLSYSTSIASNIYVLAVGGGGGGGSQCGGGGGGGGVVMDTVLLPATSNTINISVGAGGTGAGANVNNATVGGSSTVTINANTSANIIAAGGGQSGNSGYNGASGGGGGPAAGQSNNNNRNYGNVGGLGSTNMYTGGGGGAGTAGGYGNATISGNGGDGIRCFLPGISNFAPSGTAYSNYYWGGGGGGGSYVIMGGNGGLGGGGGGAVYSGTVTAGTGTGFGISGGGNGTNNNGVGGAGGVNTGSGGGGAYTAVAGAGGSGIVVIAFPNNVSIKINQTAVLPTSLNSSGIYTAVLNDASFSVGAYSSIKCACACRLLNYNYFGPVLTLRHSLDVSGSYTQNFYSDIRGNMGTGYLGTGVPLSLWLSSNGANTSCAYVTKWYGQGMDISFNSGTAFVGLNNQPIYDVINGLVNFGYTGAGSNYISGWSAQSVLASNHGGNSDTVFGNPWPIGDASYAYVMRHGNITPGTGGLMGSGKDYSATGAFTTLSLVCNSATASSTSGYAIDWAVNLGTAPVHNYLYASTAIGSYSPNNVISTTYVSGSKVRYLFVNGNSYNDSSQLSSVRGQIGNSNFIGGSNATGWFAGQLYNFFVFSTALTTGTDRQFIEATPYQYSAPATITNLTATSVTSTNFVLSWTAVANATYYVLVLNGSVYSTVTNGQTITPGFTGKCDINLNAYNSTNNLLATGYTNIYPFTISPTITNWNIGDISGTAVSNGITYNVYVFKSTVATYTMNYVCSSPSNIYVLAVGGGGGGYTSGGGGGAAGGVVMTPIMIPSGTSNITVTVGAGGASSTNGSNTAVNFTANPTYNIIAYGGGNASKNGNSYTTNSALGTAPSNNYLNYANYGGGNTASVTGGGGGGGAGTPGNQGTAAVQYVAGNGGSGIQCFLPGITNFTPAATPYGTYYWGGGGGGGSQTSANTTNNGNGGIGGGGGGANATNPYVGGIGGAGGLNIGVIGATNNGNGGNGGVNTGGGGGGAWNGASGVGGSGIVIIAFPQIAVINNINAILPSSHIYSSQYNAVLNDATFSTGAYNANKGSYACRLLNYNYFGPIMTLRHSLDTTGSLTQNFYSDICGNMGTVYLGAGQSVSSWLSSNGANTTYAFVTKWYNQGMDTSFNCATQYTIGSQPIYDVANGVINFGYQGGLGGVAAINTNAFLNLPNGAIPFNNSPYTYTLKHWNLLLNNRSTFISGGASGANLAFRTQNSSDTTVNAYLSYFYGVFIDAYTAIATPNNTVSLTYTNTPSNSQSLFINSSTTASQTFTPSSYTSNNTNNTIGLGNGSEYLNGQLYYMYILNSVLPYSDRQIIESTPYQYSTLATISGLTATIISSNSFTLNWTAVSDVSYYILWVNNTIFTTYEASAITKTVTHSDTGPWRINLYAYNASNVLLASGFMTTTIVNATASISVNSAASVTTNGANTVFTFTYSDTFTCQTTGYAGVLIVGGGGAGAANHAAGGGAGGLVYFDASARPMYLTAGTTYTVTVGTGGVYNASASAAGSTANGGNSSINGYIASGGGGGGYTGLAGNTGGGGGGGGAGAAAGSTNASSTQAVYSAHYFGGNYGGKGLISTSPYWSEGGGGGAGGPGGDGTNAGGGAGGIGYPCNITGTWTYYGGGGGGGTFTGSGSNVSAAGGAGGGGNGGYYNSALVWIAGGNGTNGLGGGGGGNNVAGGGDGGNGVVIISCPGVPAIAGLSATSVTATTFVLSWTPAVTNATLYILNINGTDYGTTYGAVTTTGTVTPGTALPWNIKLSAYNSSSVLLAIGTIYKLIPILPFTTYNNSFTDLSVCSLPSSFTVGTIGSVAVNYAETKMLVTLSGKGVYYSIYSSAGWTPFTTLFTSASTSTAVLLSSDGTRGVAFVTNIAYYINWSGKTPTYSSFDTAARGYGYGGITPDGSTIIMGGSPIVISTWNGTTYSAFTGIGKNSPHVACNISPDLKWITNGGVWGQTALKYGSGALTSSTSWTSQSIGMTCDDRQVGFLGGGTSGPASYIYSTVASQQGGGLVRGTFITPWNNTTGTCGTSISLNTTYPVETTCTLCPGGSKGNVVYYIRDTNTIGTCCIAALTLNVT